MTMTSMIQNQVGGTAPEASEDETCGLPRGTGDALRTLRRTLDANMWSDIVALPRNPQH